MHMVLVSDVLQVLHSLTDKYSVGITKSLSEVRPIALDDKCRGRGQFVRLCNYPFTITND